jgi:hypothetical protein
MDKVAELLDQSDDFPPVKLVSAGGYLATVYFQNRAATEDIDYVFIDSPSAPQWDCFYHAIGEVTDSLRWNRDWINNGLGAVTPRDPDLERGTLSQG